MHGKSNYGPNVGQFLGGVLFLLTLFILFIWSLLIWVNLGERDGVCYIEHQIEGTCEIYE